MNEVVREKKGSRLRGTWWEEGKREWKWKNEEGEKGDEMTEGDRSTVEECKRFGLVRITSR